MMIRFYVAADKHLRKQIVTLVDNHSISTPLVNSRAYLSIYFHKNLEFPSAAKSHKQLTRLRYSNSGQRTGWEARIKS